MSAPPQETVHAAAAEPIESGGRFPAFPTERAERGIQLLSRLAGPVVFFLALGGIAWLLLK
ncbi:hypothetical protein [Sphingomonas sp. UNC305MFCol5.2]|uniref:hypothetical protein n=1 Tax=Sphingomonas sp. UNC305MFCol5.2 TaxID=1449076 RepID=UPI0004A77581|nr:hypothetical protein [Sphingomonas sp. UNC305MFCol5.2]